MTENKTVGFWDWLIRTATSLFDDMTRKQRQVIHLRLGLCRDGRRHTLSEIGIAMGITHQAAQQLEYCAWRSILLKDPSIEIRSEIDLTGVKIAIEFLMREWETAGWYYTIMKSDQKLQENGPFRSVFDCLSDAWAILMPLITGFQTTDIESCVSELSTVPLPRRLMMVRKKDAEKILRKIARLINKSYIVKGAEADYGDLAILYSIKEEIEAFDQKLIRSGKQGG